MSLRRAPDFWWRRHSIAGYALAPLGFAYGRIVERRMAAAGASLGVPVVCIGNFVVGGAGKTPTAIEVAEVCRGLGRAPGFLSRGYLGAETGPVLVAGNAHRATDVGDEALLLAARAPTVISVDRTSGARLLASLGVDLIVMDDGFQNPSLRKHLSLVVVDAARAIGNGFVMPAGPLRAPLASQIRHADALVVLGEGTGGEAVRMAARAGLPVLRAHIEPLRRRGLKRRSYLAFAGMADPGKFYRALRAAGAIVEFSLDFADHHHFSDADCEKILAEAQRRNLVPITTEKDQMRLVRRGGAAERLFAAAEAFPIRLQFEEPKRLSSLIEEALAAYSVTERRDPVTAPGAAAAPA